MPQCADVIGFVGADAVGLDTDTSTDATLDTARDDAIIAGLQQPIEKFPTYRFSKLFKILRSWGHQWNWRDLR